MAKSSRKLEILKKLVTVIESVNPDNGYSDFDLRGNVIRDETMIGEQITFPLVCINESIRFGDTKPIGDYKTTKLSTWQLVIQGFVDKKLEIDTLSTEMCDNTYMLAAHVENELSKVTDVDRGDPKYPIHFMNWGLDVAAFRVGTTIIKPPSNKVVSALSFYILVEIDFANIKSPYVEI